MAEASWHRRSTQAAALGLARRWYFLIRCWADRQCCRVDSFPKVLQVAETPPPGASMAQQSDAVPMDAPVGTPNVAGATLAATVAVSTRSTPRAPPSPRTGAAATPVSLQGPKGGYLYMRIVEAGNLDGLEPTGRCCGNACDSLASFPGCCGTRRSSASGVVSSSTPLHVAVRCASLEREVNTTGLCFVDAKTNCAKFKEEILMRSLGFCGMDTATIQLQAGSVVLAEVEFPLRLALPVPLGRGVLLCRQTWQHEPISPQPRSEREESPGYEDIEVTAAQWLPCQRFHLLPPGQTWPPSTSGSGHKPQPFVDIQMLQLVDNSLPRVQGTSPLMLAVEGRQEHLVRAYLSLNVVETLPLREQEACLTKAIEKGSHEILAMLLDHVKPVHQHLLAAIQAGAVELTQSLLQAGGPEIIHPCFTSAPANVGRGTTGLGDRGTGGAATPAQPGVVATGGGAGATGGAAAGGATGRGAGIGAAGVAPVSRRPIRREPAGVAPSRPARETHAAPRLTPLSVACSLGDVGMVRALCQWARREKVHVDPSAPLLLGPDMPSLTLAGRGFEGASAISSPTAGAVSLWWDHDEWQRDPGDAPCFGDPPMVMAVRSQASTATKKQLINFLVQVGFSADIRSPVDSWTPLLAAVETGNQELVTLLVKLGARLSADRQLNFTPLHLACQTGQWHLVPFLAESMQGQYSRVAAWGPSPQYVSLNVVDVYGRTALDVLLLRYFSSPLPPSDGNGKPPAVGAERQKAVSILREFVFRSPEQDPGIVCGWELLRVLRFLDTLPAKKAVGVQFCITDWDGSHGAAPTPRKPGKVAMEKPQPPTPTYGDVEEVLQAVRVLVRAGGQTRWLPQDLLQPPPRDGHVDGHVSHNSGPTMPSMGRGSLGGSGGGSSVGAAAIGSDAVTLPFGPRARGPPVSPKFSAIDPEDFLDDEVSADDGLPPFQPPKVA